MGPPSLLLLLFLSATVAPAAPPDLEEPEDYAECSDGYEWDPETEHCKDVDECAGAGPPPCRGSMKCLNHFGGYLCLPRSAALLSPDPGPGPGPAPAPVPPPAPPRPAPAPDGRCPPGFGPAPDGTCADVDECAGPPPCRPSQDCINLPGGFECRCPPGYRHWRTECVDEDECQFRWCQHSCANSPGAFACRCHPGFSLGPDGRSCLDVDECSMGARCSQHCLNTFGSFRCRCRPGFALGADGHECHGPHRGLCPPHLVGVSQMWTSARRGSRASTAARISQGALAASAPLATLRRGGCAGTGMSALRAPTTAGGPRAASTLLGGTSVSPASSAGDPTHLTPAATGPACAPRVSPAAPPAPVGSSIVSWPFPKFPMFPLGFSSSSTPRGTPKGCGCGEAPLALFACGR
ncbi:uncharacterized protein ACIQIH_000277 isoform 3-T3 [Cyanocitta cristata]